MNFLSFSNSFEQNLVQYYQIEDRNSVSFTPIRSSFRNLAGFLNLQKEEIQKNGSHFNYAGYFYTLEQVKRVLNQTQLGLSTARITSDTFSKVFAHIHKHEIAAYIALQVDGKLPVSHGNQFSATIQKWEEEVNHPTKKSLHTELTEAFHHLSIRETDSFSEDFIEYVTGWNNPRATFSILKALENHAQQSKSDFNYPKLEAAIQRSLTFAQKHHRANELFLNQSSEQKQMGINSYYGHIGQAFPCLLQLEEAGFTDLAFLDDEELLAKAKEKFPDFDWPFLLMLCQDAHAARNNWIPPGVILLDILHGMRHDISHLQEGEQVLYPMGSSNHLVLCKIKKETNEHFSFTLYNPGDYVEKFHKTRATEEAVYAQAYKLSELSLEAVNNPVFLSVLLNVSIQSEEMVEFYQAVQDHLIHNHNGKIAPSTKWFKLPNQGICSVACWDMFLQDELPREDYKQFKMHKTSRAIQKLSHVITCYSEIVKTVSHRAHQLSINDHINQVRTMKSLAESDLTDF